MSAVLATRGVIEQRPPHKHYLTAEPHVQRGPRPPRPPSSAAVPPTEWLFKPSASLHRPPDEACAMLAAVSSLLSGGSAQLRRNRSANAYGREEASPPPVFASVSASPRTEGISASACSEKSLPDSPLLPVGGAFLWFLLCDEEHRNRSEPRPHCRRPPTQSKATE